MTHNDTYAIKVYIFTFVFFSIYAQKGKLKKLNSS